ncbi:glutamate receptor 2.7-like [Prosopis cineraria]|uniref:glutamate receptor 2.7-like n=1 Tax=Prosopis cineraria TaxID=364024 RepID=UPI00240EAFE6|nr:glutamate receptor 2.7-like [Prosopis cineraria]XP_054797683.1 glutamate receptor 2.7-like [Prosopis cineraria]
MEADFVISLGAKAHVSIITFSATSPSLSSHRSPYFFRTAQVDSAQVNAIVAILEAFGWKEAVPIYVNNDYGKGFLPFLTDALQQRYVRIPYLSVISPTATGEDIRGELYRLMTLQTRVFVVHVSSDLGSTLFTMAQQIGMMTEGYVWISTDGLANELSSWNSSVIESMQGVLAVRTYIPKSKALDDFKVRWKRKFVRDNPAMVDTHLNVFGIWAYDATTALAMAVEKVGITKHVFRKSNSSCNLNDLQNLGLVVSLNGENLRQALSNTSFQGLSGEFTVVDGQLQAPAFEIINVIGSGEKRIGFWIPQNGLVGSLDSRNKAMNSRPKSKIAPVLWPGDTYVIPKGWVIPTNGKKMRIGVPVRTDYTEFVKVTRDPITNRIEVTGFCIDVFKAVLEVLPYALPYEFIPFAKANGESAGTYDELISQVYYGNFDAVVGDTTILANRSKYVDFTLPYTESGVTMIVPMKYDRKKNAWAFLKPLTWELWATTGCSFVFIGFVVWVLEHRINDSFRGPPSHQIGTCLWFSFSTMVSAHREKLMSNLGRFVVIVWIFVVLILVQSYTASLTSLLTVEQLHPTISDVNQLIMNRLNVGCKNGSFEEEILKGLGVKDYQFKFYNSRNGCNELLTKGSENGGIAAAFGEIPYVKLFLKTYCSKYTMVDPQFKTGGLGFVFPKGSPLVADISSAILNVTQGDKMTAIENAWFKKNGCPVTGASVSSNSLGLESFWGLFLIAGLASLLALIIFVITFLYQHRHIWLGDDPNASTRKRMAILLKIFYQRDNEAFRAMKRSDTRNKSNGFGANATETSLDTHCPASPFTETDSNSSFSGGTRTFSAADYGHANSNGNADAPRVTQH